MEQTAFKNMAPADQVKELQRADAIEAVTEIRDDFGVFFRVLDLLPDNNQDHQFIEAARRATKSTVDNALALLRTKDREILEMRFGIGQELSDGLTQQQLSDRFNVTKQAIGQREQRALKAIRKILKNKGFNGEEF